VLGQEAGDQVLAQVAEVLAGQVRNEDVVCRYGGEEFVVVLPGTTVEVARERADRWRHELRSMRLPDALAGRPITISVGLSSFPSHATTGEGLVRAADEAMYAAKRLGRDRVELAVS
jgi:diguanylate cyclase (GGDEF)-like protein